MRGQVDRVEMCIILFAFQTHREFPLVLLANRDEFYARPSLPAAFWSDFPHIYGGRDQQGGGTWLGVTTGGRFAAVTNYRDPSAPAGARSRGELVADFLKSTDPVEGYLEDIRRRSHEYSAFNLLTGELSGDRQELYYYSNRIDEPQRLLPGVYGLSNHLLDTAWPKVKKGKARLADMIASGDKDNNKFFDLLADKTLADDEDLPSTGIPNEAEKAISSIFIQTPGYGTRCSTRLVFGSDLSWDFEERVFV